MSKKTLSRRDFIKAAGVAAGAGVLVACTPQAAPATAPATQAGVSPTAAPENVVLDVWQIIDLPDLDAHWEASPDNPEFATQWYKGGLLRVAYKPFLENHPGVSLKITGHSWDWDLRQNMFLALAAGITPDTTYGEAYVAEFVHLGVLAPVSDAVANLFAEGSTRVARKDGRTHGLPETSGANALFINLDNVERANLDPTRLPATWDELLTMAKAISAANDHPRWGNNAYFTYAPAPENFGIGLRILHWFDQNNAPLGSDLGVPSANIPGAAETWLFHNELMWTSNEDTILNLDAAGEVGSAEALNEGIIALKAGWSNDGTTVGNADANVVAVPYPIPTGGRPASVVIGNQVNSPMQNAPHRDLAIALIEESVNNVEAQVFLPDNAGIWIPALKSLLEQHETFDRLGGYKSEKAKDIVRVTMKVLLDGGAAPLPGWPKNGGRIWNAWNESYGRIWRGNLGRNEIQAELDALQTTIEGLLQRTG
jgi:ABC-type glycerol-3-phosphate transport system substrate-binding protein